MSFLIYDFNGEVTIRINLYLFEDENLKSWVKAFACEHEIRVSKSENKTILFVDGIQISLQFFTDEKINEWWYILTQEQLRRIGIRKFYEEEI
jgi:hypothetical protein